MSSTRLRRRRIAASCALSILASVCLAPAALATAEHYWPGGNLGANTSYEGSVQHSMNYIQGNADHNNFCVSGDAPGYPGYGGAPVLTTRIKACAPTGGGGTTGISYSPVVCCQVGEIENNNSFTINAYYATHYDW